MPDSKTTTVDIIARRLHDAGCRYDFGILGGEVLAMMNAPGILLTIPIERKSYDGKF